MALITGYWCMDILIGFCLLIILAYLYMTRNFNYWEKRNVSEIPAVPFLGSFKDVILQKKSAGPWFEDMYKKYEGLPFVGLYILDKPFLILRDIEIIKHILIKDAENFPDKNFTANEKDVLGDANLFLIKNPRWKYLRHKLTPVYTSKKLRQMFDLMIDVCGEMSKFLKSQNIGGEGAVLEMKDLAATFMTDLIATTAYGIKANSFSNPDADFRKHGREIFAFSTYRGYEFLAMFFAPHLTKIIGAYFFKKENVAFLRNALWSILEKRQKSGIKRHDLIDLLIDLRKNQPEEEKKIFDLDGDNLVAQAAVFFTGGFETSSTTMSFALYEIATHPQVQNKLRHEIKAALDKNNGILTYEMVTSDLPYLDMVIAETLRFYPPLPFLDRVPLQNYRIPGTDLVLEKGIPVIVPMLGLHMDEKYFPEPHCFNPDHFSEENQKARDSGVYMPFGAGPHICIGKRYGLIQTKLGLITILSNYEVLPCNKTLIPMKISSKAIFTTSDDGIYLKIRKLINQ